MLDANARTRVQIAATMLSGNSLRQTVHTQRASVHQAGKLVAALLRVAGVTAGLAESDGSLPSGLCSRHVTCRLTAKNRDQLRNPTLGNRVWATFTFFILVTVFARRTPLLNKLKRNFNSKALREVTPMRSQVRNEFLHAHWRRQGESRGPRPPNGRAKIFLLK